MKLVLLTEEFYADTSGGANARTRFAELAVERGHEVVVFMPNNHSLPEYEEISGIEIHRSLPSLVMGNEGYAWLSILMRVLFSIHLTISLLWWMRGEDIDCLHPVSNSLHWSAWFLRAVYSIPVVNFIGYTPSVESSKTPWSPRSMLESINFRFFMGDVVFCRTPAVANTIRKLSDAKVEVLDGILNKEKVLQASDCNFEKVRHGLGVEDEDTLIVFIGRLVPIKQPIDAVDIVDQLPDSYKLVIIGDGPSRTDVETGIANRGLDEQIKMVGEVSHDRVFEFLGASDMLILTSRAEAYPTVVFEALACSTPVCATAVGILPEIMNENIHISAVSDIPTTIREQTFDAKHQIDKQTLEAYSMEMYTERILEAVSELNRQ